MRYSIITINWNNGNGLHNTCKSVMELDYEYEFIVIDGGSTDNSLDVIKEYESIITYWVSEKDKGIYNAMNKGIAQAHGDYCIFMNSGDCFIAPEVLTKFRPYNEDIITGVTIGTDGHRHSDFQAPLSMFDFYIDTISHQASFIKTKLLKEENYDESLRILADWKFFIHQIIFKNCSFRFVEEPVVLFEMGGVSLQRPDLWLQERQTELAKMLPPRILSDYEEMKQSTCLTQKHMKWLKRHYTIDKFLHSILIFISKYIK